jgi:hypothetical protein
VDVIIVALIVSVIAPMMLGFLTNRAARAAKREDWARQDAVADRAEHAAELLLAEQQKIRANTEKVAVLAASTAATTADQLAQVLEGNQEIHHLVNSDMTAARQELLDQTRLLVRMYRKTISRDEAAGRTPAESDETALRDAEIKVTELQHILADRLAQQRMMEVRQAEMKGGA